MSAASGGDSNGVPKSQKPNPLRPMRKKPNPLVGRIRKPVPKPTNQTPKAPQPNGSKQVTEEQRRQYGGWSEPPPSLPFNDIPIMTTKKALLEGIRYHLMRFSQAKVDDKPVDPTDQEEFARPVTLHRRDPRQPPPGRAVKEEEPEPPQIDEQEIERQVQAKAEKEAQRAMDQAKIAPVMKENKPKKQPKKPKEEKTSFNRAPKSEMAKKESDLRYEEALPWHLEDADGKNVWVGNYVAALSEANVVFMIDKAVFRMIPVEKWYRFTSKPPFQPFTIDQAEAFMNRKVDAGRWIMKDNERKAGQNDLDATRRMFYGRGAMVKTESDTFKAASRSEKLEHDELDVSGDEFQDDDETPHFDRNEDEDTKDSKDRIRREQLGANLFGEGDEQVVDKDLKEELREELDRQRYGKTTKKALIKRDHEDIYESDDSQVKPWSSSSEDESSGDDGDNEDDDQDDQDGNNGDGKDKDKDKDLDKENDKDKPKASGVKGTTTPQGKQKASEALKKSKSLKRAGSPTLSESSGNESSRKKIRKTATPAAGSRSGSPLPQIPRQRSKMGAGSGSDGEGTAGEMSDGALPKRKLKLAASGGRGTPSASRSGSPNPIQGNLSPRAYSSAIIEPSEIIEKIPPEGIKIAELIQKFSGRVGDGPGMMKKQDWIKLVKEQCEYGPDRRLHRKKEGGS